MKEISKISKGECTTFPSFSKNKDEASLIRSREKRIAEKSIKSLDIISSQLMVIYKEFVTMHVSQLNDPHVKSI